MFDFYHWADWVSRETAGLRSKGLQASYAFAEDSRASANPAFLVDFDADRNLGRIIVWSSGDFDISVHRDLSTEAHPIADLPQQATDQNFRVLFGRFVAEVIND